MIYYEKFDEPIPYSHTIRGHLHEGVVEGEGKCDHPLVEKVWWTASTSADPNDSIMRNQLNLLMNTGNQIFTMYFTRRVTPSDVEDINRQLIEEATNYLNQMS